MTMAPINNLKLLNLLSSTYPRLVTIYAANQWPLQSRNRITTNKRVILQLTMDRIHSGIEWSKKRWDLGDGLVEKMLDGAGIWEVGLFGLAALLHFDLSILFQFCFSFTTTGLLICATVPPPVLTSTLPINVCHVTFLPCHSLVTPFLLDSLLFYFN